MKSRTQVCCIAVCLVVAAVLVVAFKGRSTAAPSSRSTSHLDQLEKPRIFIEPAPTMAAASLWNGALPISSLLPEDPGGGIVFQQDRPYNPALPTAEELILTPPNSSLNNNQTILSVRFQELAAEKLNASIPIILSKQHVVLQRSAEDPSVFSTPIDFDWHAFAREQQQRKDGAERGITIPMFEGRHFVGRQPIQFVDPADIESALQNHQPIHFSRHIIEGALAIVLPNKELMVTDIPVVTDPLRTWDPCNPTGNVNGAWSFKTLMKAIRNGDNNGSNIALNAEIMLDRFLATWQSNQTINSFSVPSRPNINNFLANWPVDSTGHHSLDQAPVRLNAIVNRIDLGQAPNSPTPAGELRFVFGVTAGTGASGCGNPNQPFNIILEYDVPSSIDASTWAQEWNALANLLENDSPTGYMAALQAMTDQVVTANKCPSCPNGSSLAQLRTNEIELGAPWELRQFHLAISSTPSNLVETTVSQAPEGSFTGFTGGPFGAPPCAQNPNGCASNEATVTNFILLNLLQIDNGSYIVPTSFGGVPFLGGSIFNGGPPADGFWNGDPSVNQAQHKERTIFSENTCNGCHGREVRTDAFQQVVNNRTTTTPSGLTGFLLGCTDGTTCQPGAPNQCSLDTPNLACIETVQDPVFSTINNSFGDIARRVVVLQGLLPQQNGIRSGGVLLPFNRPQISFVH
jgi:hypothetical protein